MNRNRLAVLGVVAAALGTTLFIVSTDPGQTDSLRTDEPPRLATSDSDGPPQSIVHNSVELPAGASQQESMPEAPSVQYPSTADEVLALAVKDPEAAVIFGDSLSGDALKVIADEAFIEWIQALSMTGDGQEQFMEISGTFSNAQDVLSGNVILEAMACSARLCAVALSGPTEDAVDAVTKEVTAFGTGHGYSSHNFHYERNGRIERNMVITVDRSIDRTVSGVCCRRERTR